MSKAIWGAIASIVSGVGMLIGVDVDKAGLSEALIQASGPISAVVGGLIAVWGRKTARSRIE